MAPVVENCHPIPVAGVLKDIDNVIDGDIGPLHDFAQAHLFGQVQRLAQAIQFLGQVAQVAGVIDPVVGKGEKYDGFVGHP